MKVPQIGEGFAIGVGSTHFRAAGYDNNEEFVARTFEKIDVPKTREEFFAATASRLLESAHAGAKWAVLGVPGPVSVHVTDSGEVDQSFSITNIAGLNNSSGIDPIEGIISADSAADELFRDDEFNFLTINDGDMAAQAAAHLYAIYEDVVASEIDGTGTGGAVVRRDKRFKDQSIWHPDAGLWEIGHEPLSMVLPDVTIETLISGKGIEDRLGMKAELLESNDPHFNTVAHMLGKLAFNFGIKAGAELVVISGGVGIGARSNYMNQLNDVLLRMRESKNPMSKKLPAVQIVKDSHADTYEMYGAPGAMRSWLIRRKIDELVAQAD